MMDYSSDYSKKQVVEVKLHFLKNHDITIKILRYVFFENSNLLRYAKLYLQDQDYFIFIKRLQSSFDDSYIIFFFHIYQSSYEKCTKNTIQKPIKTIQK